MATKTFSVGEVLTASDTNTYLANAGLVYITQVTASASSLVQFNNVFSATYDQYLLVGRILWNTTTGFIGLKLQDASNNAITGNYDCHVGGGYVSSGVQTFATFNSASANNDVFIGGSVSSDYMAFTTTFVGPALAIKTYGAQTFQADNYSSTLTNVFVQGGWSHTLATAYYGFRLTPTAGTMTGTFTLYGYRLG